MTVYTEAGVAFFDGREPYDVTNIRGWKYLYPPLFAIVVSPLHALPSTCQATIFFAVSILLCLGSYLECRRLLVAWAEDQPRESRDSLDRFVQRLCGLAALTVLFPALNCLQRGQVGVVALYPLLLGFRLVLLGKTPTAWCVGGLLLALPIVIKLTPILPVFCVLLTLLVALYRHSRHPYRQQLPLAAAAAATPQGLLDEAGSRSIPRSFQDHRGPCWTATGFVAGCLLFVLVIPGSLIGWQPNLRHLNTWLHRIVIKVEYDRMDTFAGQSTSIRNQSLLNGLQRFGNWAAYEFAGGPDDLLLDTAPPAIGVMPMDDPRAMFIVDLLRVISGVVLIAAVVTLGYRGDQLSLGFALGLGAVATFVVSPVARAHYFVLYLPAVLYGGLWLRQRMSERRALQFAAIPMLLCLTHYLALPYAGRLGVLGIGTTIWFFAACAIVLTDFVACRAERSARTPSGPRDASFRQDDTSDLPSHLQAHRGTVNDDLVAAAHMILAIAQRGVGQAP